MDIIKDFYKAFQLHRIIFEFTSDELKRAIFTEEEQAILNIKDNSFDKRLVRAQILARGIERGNAKNPNYKPKTFHR